MKAKELLVSAGSLRLAGLILVVAGNAVRQRQKGFQPRFLRFAEILKIHEIFRTTQHRQYCDHQNVRQKMITASLNSGISDDG